MTTSIEEAEMPQEAVAIERMVFAWWNSSLSPFGKKRADEKHKEIANLVVKSLIDELKVDCLALAEVTSENLSAMAAACCTPALRIYEGTLKEGKLQFDTGIIYNSNRLSLTDSFSSTNSHGRRNFKVSNRLDFLSLSDGMPMHVFMSHWPSRARSEENRHLRTSIAQLLKEELGTVRRPAPDAAIVLMGDFNDEPFDRSISWHLLATRDRHLARTGNGYLYNPFWRKLGESQPYARSRHGSGAAGTCFYRKSTDTSWRTFDQILFSSAFIGNSQWHLREEDTKILATDALIQLVQDDKVLFDHLPVLGVIERFVEEE